MAALSKTVEIGIDEVYATWKDAADHKSPPCVVRIPQNFKNLKENAYVPESVGLGPYHHSNMRSQKMEALRRALRRAIRSKGLKDSRECVSECLDGLRKLVNDREDQIKELYAEDFEFEADSFILDALFVLEICISFKDEVSSEQEYACFDFNSLVSTVGFVLKQDVWKLENQIPLFLLIELLKWQGISKSWNIADVLVIMVADVPFREQDHFKFSERLHTILFDEKRPPRHLVELMHLLMVDFVRGSNYKKNQPTDSQGTGGWKIFQRKKKGDKGLGQMIPTVRELKKSRIAVKCSDGLWFEERRFGVKKKGVLHLPALVLSDCSEILLRNVMALEELCGRPHYERYFNRYMCLLTNLIHTRHDAALLIKAGVIDNYLNSQQIVADLFNTLCTDFVVGVVPEIEDGIVKKLKQRYI